MLKFILIAVLAILFAVALVKVIDKFMPSKFRPVVSVALWVLIACLAYQTYHSVYTPVLFNKERNKRYALVIKNMMDIRDAELAHREVTGKFTSSFDSLVKFIDTAKYTITQRKDTSVIDAAANRRYGLTTMTKDIVIIDTLGYVSIKDSLFKKSERYRTMMNVPSGKPGARFKLQAGFIDQDHVRIPVFEVSVKKATILYDQDSDLVAQENQVVSVDGVSGDALKVGSMEQIKTTGNWPKNYGKIK